MGHPHIHSVKTIPMRRTIKLIQRLILLKYAAFSISLAWTAGNSIIININVGIDHYFISYLFISREFHSEPREISHTSTDDQCYTEKEN